MKKLPLKKLNRARTADGVINDVKNYGFCEYNGETVTLTAVFKGRERHTRSRKKADGTRVKLQSYTLCEGAQNAAFIAVSVDNADKNSSLKHISCTVFIKNNLD